MNIIGICEICNKEVTENSKSGVIVPVMHDICYQKYLTSYFSFCKESGLPFGTILNSNQLKFIFELTKKELDK